jgi:hypothetical protein
MSVSEAAIRKFRITANQYEVFRFRINQTGNLRIRMFATAPVNLFLLSSDDKIELEERGIDSTTYTTAWSRRSDLDTIFRVDPGTWYLVVEGSTEPSTGRIEVLEE